MALLLKAIRHNPLLWLLAFVPVLFAAAKLKPESHRLLFVLSVAAVIPLAGMLSHATESVAPELVLASYAIGSSLMSLQLWPGAVVMILFATLAACLTTNSGRSTWFIGVLLLMVYLVFACSLYLLPPKAH